MKRVVCFESEGIIHVHLDRLEFIQDGQATFACPVEDLGLVMLEAVHSRISVYAFALADDMMEPYRPFVDEIVFGLTDVFGKSWSRMNFDSRVRRELLNVVGCDVVIDGLCYPLALALDKTAQSFADVVTEKSANVLLPEFA